MRAALLPLRLVLVALLGAAVLGCSSRPRPLVAGSDACDFCRMAVSDTRFGGEVITREGRLRTFDSVECLASYVAAAGEALAQDAIYVADYHTSAMIVARSARFVRGGTLQSPMGQRLASFAPSADAAALAAEFGGEVMSWDEVQAWVKANTLHERSGAADDHPAHDTAGHTP